MRLAALLCLALAGCFRVYEVKVHCYPLPTCEDLDYGCVEVKCKGHF